MLVVTARKEDISSPDVGAAYVFHRKGRTWKQEAKLTASDPNPAALFGQSAAVQGNLIVIGARDADTPVANGAGALYLFGWIHGKWVEFDKLYASDGKSGDQFAFNIAVSGKIIAAGARRADLTSPNRSNAGAVYLFGFSGHEWKEIQKLTASDAKAGDEFGHSVAMSGDGDFIAVGARRADIDGNTDQGAVYIFRRSDDHGHFGSTGSQSGRKKARSRRSTEPPVMNLAIRSPQMTTSLSWGRRGSIFWRTTRGPLMSIA